MQASGKEKLITFFMPVVEKNICLADYCVRSYSKIRDIPFSLRIYFNHVEKSSRDKYSERWSKLPFVDILEYEDHGKILEHGEVLDRGLKKIDTPYIATVDYDLEILDPKFISDIIDKLRGSENLIAVSVEQTFLYGDPHRNRVVIPKWAPCFCVYKRDVLKVGVSHKSVSETIPGKDFTCFYDTSAKLQEVLIKKYGFNIVPVFDPPQGKWGLSIYQSCYLHHGGLSWNNTHDVKLTEANARYYRLIRLIYRRGVVNDSEIFRMLSRMIFFVLRRVGIFG